MDMGRILKISTRRVNLVLMNGALRFYDLNSGCVGNTFDLERLLLDKQYYEGIVKSGYNLYKKEFWNEKGEVKLFYIDLSEAFIEFYQLNWDAMSYRKGCITLCNIDLNYNVDVFYEFSIEIEIDSFRTKFIESFVSEKLIYIDKPYNDEKLEAEMTRLLGDPQIPSDIGYDKGGPYYYYIVPTSKIDKIIGIKRFRDTTTFGQENGEQFTGEVEEVVLDLHNFNQEIYQIFKEHGMLEIGEE